MARPKRVEGESSAQERIEEAFWQLLADHDYDDITIKMLASHAKVNHNLLYYYYQNIADIAACAFENTLLHTLPNTLMSMMSEMQHIDTSFMAEGDVGVRIQKIRLLASSNSLYLINILKNGLINTWLSQFGKSRDDVTKSDLLELDFIFSGVVSLIASLPEKNPEKVVSEFLKGEMGKGVMRTLKRIVG